MLNTFLTKSSGNHFVWCNKPLDNLSRWHNKKHFCEIILNLDRWFKIRCCLRIFLIYSSSSHLVRQFGTICAFLNLDQWFSKCCLKYFLSKALAVLLIAGEEPFLQYLTLEHIYSHCLINFNISSENYDFGFKSIHKKLFKKNSM